MDLDVNIRVYTPCVTLEVFNQRFGRHHCHQRIKI